MTPEEVRERLRFLSAAQHEANTPLAVIRGWADTFATMWPDLGDDNRERGTQAIQRYTSVLAGLMDALFVELRADAHARVVDGGASDLAEVVPIAVDQVGDLTLIGDVPSLDVPLGRDALELLIGAAANGVVARFGAPASLTVVRAPDGALLTLSPPPDAPPDAPSATDPFDPFPDVDPSPAGIRLTAARRLATQVGGRLVLTEDGTLELRLPQA